ncbi:MAG: GNAT family N-acetyltransferase [Caldilineaceae bacterium]
MRYAIPLAAPLVDELIPFWATIFGDGLPDIERAVFLGAEEAYSRSKLYLRREGEQVAGTCFMMHATAAPALAGLGEVATDPHLRGRGIATELCSQAVADLRAAGGEALFLGTVNPVAARIYHRLGWRKLAGANVMVNLTAALSPEEFLVDYFRRPGQVTIGPVGPDVRVPMIPLILTPHDSLVLDANVEIYSCRYRTQNSCMGLYPRYVRGLQERQGACFAARTDDGRVVGLATALPAKQEAVAGDCQIDGFVHQRFAATWPALIEAACSWARAYGATEVGALIAAEDTEKQAVFQSLGFVCQGLAATLEHTRMTTWRVV